MELLEPLEAEAKLTDRPLAEVLAARLDRSAEPAAPPRRLSPAGTAGRGRQPKVTHAKPTGPVPIAAPARPAHLATCKCGVCKPTTKGAKR